MGHWTSTQTLAVAGPGLILDSNPDLDVMMAPGCTQIRMVPTAAWSSFTIITPGSSSDFWHLHGPQGDRTHRHQHRLLGHFRASNKNLALDNSPAQPWTWVGSRPFLSACSSLLTSSDTPPSLVYEQFCLSLSSISPPFTHSPQWSPDTWGACG